MGPRPTSNGRWPRPSLQARDRWEQVEDGRGGTAYQLFDGGDDEPEYSIDEILGFVLRALVQFLKGFEVVLTEFETLLAQARFGWSADEG